jgi:hypothetical protein
MGRREEREELQRTWVVYQPLKKGVPIRKSQLERLADEEPGTLIGEDGIVRKPDENQGP